MPYNSASDNPSLFVLGPNWAGGGASTGWWNTPSLRTGAQAPRYGGGGGGGSVGGTVSVRAPDFKIPGFDYSAGVATPSTQLTDLTNYINNLNRTAQTLANQARIPGAAGLEDISSQNIASGLKGELPADVMRLLQRQAAERGGGVGPESPNVNASYLQGLGLTSLQRQEQAQKDLTAAYARNPGAPLFDPTSQLLKPNEANELYQQMQKMQLEADLANQRADLERARLALAGSYGGGGGGGGTRGGYNPNVSTDQMIDPRTRTATGATGSLLGGSVAPDFSQSDWYASLGITYDPKTGQRQPGGPSTSSGPGSYYAGPNDFGGLTADELYQGFGVTPSDWDYFGYTSLNDLYGGGP